MSREIASVHLDIARFILEVFKTPPEERGNWVTGLAECWALRDPNHHAYGALMLQEAQAYAAAKSQKNRDAANAMWKGKREKRNASSSHGAYAPASSIMQPHAPAFIDMHTDATDQDSAGKSRAVDPPLPPNQGIDMDFETAWLAYPGPKRAVASEWEDFNKKYGKRAAEFVTLLLPAIDTYREYVEKKAKNDRGTPIWKHLTAWLGEMAWTMVYPGEGAQKSDNSFNISLLQQEAKERSDRERNLLSPQEKAFRECLMGNPPGLTLVRKIP